MNVDKFGRTSGGGSCNCNSSQVVGGGLTLAQANNTFLRRDGGNTATGVIDMTTHKLVNVADPTSNKDAANKEYVDSRSKLPTSRFQKPSGIGSQTYDWVDNDSIPSSFSEADFDSLPSGFYSCFTNYLPPTRLGSLPANTKGYLTCIIYQQPADRNKYYKWINSTNGEEWEAYFKQSVWTTWVNSSKVSKSGDIMSGDLNMGAHSINNVVDPTTAQQAATKNYVDLKNVGYSTSGVVPVMTSNNTPTPYIASASTEFTSEKAYGAFTQGLTHWAPANSGEQWVEIYLGSQVSVGSFTLKGRYDQSAWTVGWYVSASNDGVNYYILYNGNVEIGSAAQTFQIPISTIKPYSYYRFVGTAKTLNLSGLDRFDLYYASFTASNKVLTDVVDPISSQDAATKNYVDAKDALKVYKAGDSMTGDLVMGGNLVKGLPTTYPPIYNGNEAASWSQVVGLVNDATKNNSTVPAGDNYLTNKKYVDEKDALKVAKAGDTMTGDLKLNVGADLLRTLGCMDLSGSKGFSILLGSIMNQIQCQLNTPITLQTTNGFLCKSGGNDVIRFGKSSTDNRTDVYQDIVMNQHFIADLCDPASAQDAATKNYVDTRVGPLARAIAMNAFTIGTALTKLQYNSKTFDLTNSYNTTTYRFTPNVAGYYSVTANIQVTSTLTTYLNLVLYKNGALYSNLGNAGGTQGFNGVNGSDIVIMNGTTDYLEIYGQIGNTTATTVTGTNGGNCVCYKFIRR